MKYGTIVADPPWEMPGGGGRRGGQPRLPYSTMTFGEICTLDVPSQATPDCNLFLWTTEAFLVDGTARRVVDYWGFKAPRVLIWRKSIYGLGDFPRRQHEFCLVANRGRATWRRRDVGSVQDWNVVFENGVRKHSAKPEGFFDLVESVSPGPYLELFARRARFGWDYWGDESLATVELASGS